MSSTEKIDNKNVYIIINDKYKFLLKDKENGDVEIIYEGVAVSKDLTLSSYDGTYISNSGSFEITNNCFWRRANSKFRCTKHCHSKFIWKYCNGKTTV
ncbi:MAG: hypothetical protein ACLRTR_02430 [Clostridia bacterium]